MFFMRWLLKFCEDAEGIWWHGALFAVGLASVELIRVVCFGVTWGISYRSVRACQTSPPIPNQVVHLLIFLIPGRVYGYAQR